MGEAMEFTTAVATCIAKYATFSGRARRAEFWWFTLFNLFANFVLGFVDLMFFGLGHGVMDGAQPLSTVFSLAVLLPSLAVGARRLHDTGRSGWWQLLVFVPLFGALILIWWFASRGGEGPNQYGPDPLSGGDAYGESSVPKVPRR
jgi:uncharacterized membrane protein YhaH (DUF805 family)